MSDYLVLRLEGPLQAWGGVALDTRRPSRAFPSLSGLAGLLASALGWGYRDGERTTALQDALEVSIREDRAPERLMDYQTVDLGAMPSKGWTRWGIEERGGAFSSGTHILHKEYLTNASFAVALGLQKGAPVALSEIGEALVHPARPLFLGRKSCPPSVPIAEGRKEGASSLAVLRRHPVPAAPTTTPRTDATYRFWFPVELKTDADEVREIEVWDRRDFLRDRFEGSRRLVEAWLTVNEEAQS